VTNQKDNIRRKFKKLVDDLANDTDKPKEYIANEIFYYIQRHKEWGRNATKTQKRASFKYHKGKCSKCNKPINSIDGAKFHHLERGVPKQHEPENLVPQHLKCHDEEHGVLKGSLSKGTPRKIDA
jgi:hypothetical protein